MVEIESAPRLNILGLLPAMFWEIILFPCNIWSFSVVSRLGWTKVTELTQVWTQHLVKIVRRTCSIVVSSWLKWGEGVKVSGRFIGAGGHNWNLRRLFLFNVQNGRIPRAMLSQVVIFQWPLK